MPVSLSLDVGSIWEMMQIEHCPCAYYIFITWSRQLQRPRSTRADPPNLPVIWGDYPSPMDRKYKSQIHDTVCPQDWDTRSRFVPNAHFWVPLFVPNAPFVVLRLTENRTFLMPNLFLMLIFGFPDLFLMLIFGFRGAREI